MSGENQYINPIIETLFKTYQGQHDAEELKARTDQYRAQNAFNEEQLKQQDTHFQRQHDFEDRVFNELHLPNLNLARKAHQLTAIHTAMEMAKNGASPQITASAMGGTYQSPTTFPPTGQFPGLSTPGNIQLEGGQNIPASALPSSQSEAERIKGMIKAQLEAKEPFDIASEGRALAGKKTLQQQENDFKSQIEDKNTVSREKIAKLERDAQMMIANSHNATALQVAHINKDISPDQMQAGIIAGLTGQRAFNSDNVYDRAVMSGIQQAGGRVVDKKDAQALQSMQGLNPVFDKLEKFANENLRTSKTGAMVQGATQKLANEVGYPTDKQTQLDEIKSQALKIGRELEGLTGGRMNVKQLELDLNSIGGAGQTKEQALDRLKNLRNVYINREQNQILGGMPEGQKKLIYSTYGIKPQGELPEWLKTAPKTSKIGGKLDEDKSIELGHPVYK